MLVKDSCILPDDGSVSRRVALNYYGLPDVQRFTAVDSRSNDRRCGGRNLNADASAGSVAR
jgi:hypothetical protein